MPQSRPLTALVCDHDHLVLRATSALLEELGFEILGDAHNAVEAIREAEFLKPSLVVMTHEQVGISGLEALPDLRRIDPAPEVVLIAIDGHRIHDATREAGGFEVVDQGDGPMLRRVLEEARELLVTGERRATGSDRRTGADRRVHQDWSKVISERRSGEDRRKGSRRGEGSESAGTESAGTER